MKMHPFQVEHLHLQLWQQNQNLCTLQHASPPAIQDHYYSILALKQCTSINAMH